MFSHDITAEDLRQILDYDPNTGVFMWRTRPAKCIHVGDVAGAKDKRGYITIGIRGKVYKAHRLAWLHTHGEWPSDLMDHMDGNKSNNRLSNLRVTDASGNTENIRKPNRRNKSGFLGVIRFQNKWRASITIRKKTHWIGDFDTPEEAHQAYLNVKRQVHARCTI